MEGKIIKLDEVEGVREAWAGKRAVLVGGCFDLLHYGHYAFLKAAKQEGDILIIALESDEFIKNRKKREPVHTQRQRAEILAALRMVDYVIELPLLNSDNDYSSLVHTVCPAVLAVTKGDVHVTKKERHANAIGAKVVSVSPVISSFSTSSIITYASILSD